MSTPINNATNPRQFGRASRGERTHFNDLEKAMSFFEVPVRGQRTVRETIRALRYDELWVPATRGYIAVAYDGVIIAKVRKTRISITGRPRVPFPA